MTQNKKNGNSCRFIDEHLRNCNEKLITSQLNNAARQSFAFGTMIRRCGGGELVERQKFVQPLRASADAQYNTKSVTETFSHSITILYSEKVDFSLSNPTYKAMSVNDHLHPRTLACETICCRRPIKRYEDCHISCN